jgi:hypothetical protein
VLYVFTIKLKVGAVEGGLTSPLMVIVRVAGLIVEDELIFVRIMVFELFEHVGVIDLVSSEALVHEIEEEDIDIVGGRVMVIMPFDDIGSLIVIVKVYDV